MIPKKIHYCWFGRGEMPKLAKRCMNSWKKYCPDYEIIEWNEDNFDINCCDYVREAYENRKYAFVTDYVRLYVVYTYGGIYMDTDVELVSGLDKFLLHKGFAGFETETYVQTGIMAGEKDFSLFKELLEYYHNKVFVDKEGNLDMTTNVITITSMLSEKDFIPNGKFQSVEGLVLYPKEYFCPLDDTTGILQKSSNTVAIHWFNKSWISPMIRFRSKITRIIHRLFGVDSLAFLRKKKQ